MTNFSSICFCDLAKSDCVYCSFVHCKKFSQNGYVATAGYVQETELNAD